MNTLDYVKIRQKQWALRNEIPLTGSRINKGDSVYTTTLENNLFQGLCDSTKEEFQDGDGNELDGSLYPAKMQALHSSSALGVNVFEYLRANSKFELLAKILKIPSRNINDLRFEQKYEIFKNEPKSPNIDVSVHYENGTIVGIECKFTEPFQYRNQNSGLKEKYLKEFHDWEKFPNLNELARSISPNDNVFEFLHCAQLIKHTMGMHTLIKDKKKIKLLYIYQPAYFENNEKYISELEIFRNSMSKDQIIFRYISWPELFKNIAKYIQPGDQDYSNYLFTRYL